MGRGGRARNNPCRVRKMPTRYPCAGSGSRVGLELPLIWQGLREVGRTVRRDGFREMNGRRFLFERKSAVYEHDVFQRSGPTIVSDVRIDEDQILEIGRA